MFFSTFYSKKMQMPPPEQALEGRESEIATSEYHFVNGHPLKGPFNDKYKTIIFGMGCFWGAERLFWQLPGVYVTAVGYAGGYTPNPTYEEVCTGMTGHTEVVKVVYDPDVISLKQLLQIFWQEHDPTQGMRQGNDLGTNYRSAIYTDNPADLDTVLDSRLHYQNNLQQNRFGTITTEVADDVIFYYAESEHQQYLAKNPNGYCGLKGTGVSCSIG